MSQPAYNPEIELLLSQLRDTYVKLAPSPVAGVGVFAICDIPKGCRSMFTKDTGEWIEVPRQAVESLPAHVRAMVENCCTFSKESFFIERGGFKKMDLSCYVNHSDTPNIAPNPFQGFFDGYPLEQGVLYAQYYRDKSMGVKFGAKEFSKYIPTGAIVSVSQDNIDVLGDSFVQKTYKKVRYNSQRFTPTSFSSPYFKVLGWGFGIETMLQNRV